MCGGAACHSSLSAANLSVKEIKAALRERNVDFSKCIEVSELRDLLSAALHDEQQRHADIPPKQEVDEGVFAQLEGGGRCWVELIADSDALCHREDGGSGVVDVASLRPLSEPLRGPLAFEGSFEEARAAAFFDGKVMGGGAEKASRLHELCLASEEVVDLLGENAVFWQGAARDLRDLHAQQLAPSGPPSLAMVLPLAVDAMRVISAGTIVSKEAVVTPFVEALEAQQSHRDAADARLVSEDAQLRQAQVEEFEAALAADRARACGTDAPRGATSSASADRAAQKRPAEGGDSRAAAEDEEAERLSKHRRLLAEEFLAGPALEDGVAAARLLLRLPTGERVERTFSASDRLDRVLAWAECCALLPEAQGRALRVPANFALATGFPPRRLEQAQSSSTLQELGLAPSAALLLLDTDS